MAFVILSTSIGRLGGLVRRWRNVGLAIVGAALCEVGARVALPNLDAHTFGDVIRRSGLLALYDRLVSGGLSRGAVLALGIMPYISARIYVRVARALFPRVGALQTNEPGRLKLRRWTRGLTVGFAAAQSYGFARFVETFPGAVANPGPGFVVQTTLILTAGALFVMGLGEAFDEDPIDESDVKEVEIPSVDVPLPPGLAQPDAAIAIEASERAPLLLEPGEYRPNTENAREYAPEVLRTRRDRGGK